MEGYQKIIDALASGKFRASFSIPLVTEPEVPIRREKDKDETIDASHGSFDNNLDAVNRAIRRIRGPCWKR